MSGSGLTNCSVGHNPGTDLYSKSPKARETARLPFTRCIITEPPALTILSRSRSRYGLWSSVLNVLLLFLLHNPRESPKKILYFKNYFQEIERIRRSCSV